MCHLYRPRIKTHVLNPIPCFVLSRDNNINLIGVFQAGIEAAKKSEQTAEHSDSGSMSGNEETTAPAASIHQAAKSGSITSVRKLIEKDPSLKTYVSIKYLLTLPSL